MKRTFQRSNVMVAVMLLVAILFSMVPASTAQANSVCDWAQFVADVTVPDGTVYAAGAAISKTWRLRNIGTCTWVKDTYSAVFVDGSQMGAPASVAMPSSVAPGGTVDITVSMTAPASAGTYRGNWQLRNASGVNFGIGGLATRSFWVEVRVTGGSDGGTAYDFAANASSAQWSSGYGNLPFPGTDGDAAGFARKLDNPVMENGVTSSSAGLLTVPQNIYGGYVQGVFPAFTVQSGDRFSSIINCERNATSCYVEFRLNYQIGSGPVYTLRSFREAYEGQYYQWNVDLSSLAGQSVKFILYVNAYGYASGDRALWVAPKIVRGGISPTATPVVTNTPNPASCDRVQFVADVNYPDGTVIAPNTNFTKTWRIKNIGSCTWTTDYKLVYVSGNQMNGAASTNLTSTVGPNTTFDLSVNLRSPATAGLYRGYWMLQNKNGQNFGIGWGFTQPWWVDIAVSGTAPTVTPTVTGTIQPTATPTATSTGAPTSTATATATVTPTAAASTDFYFTTHPELATWTSGAGAITFGETAANDAGVAYGVSSVTLEGNTTYSQPSLVLVPQNVTDGYVQGVYPARTVNAGEKLYATVGCMYTATDCWVHFIIYYQIGSNTPVQLLDYKEKNDGLNRDVVIDLNSLAGQSVKFILKALTYNGKVGSLSQSGWVNPRIVK